MQRPIIIGVGGFTSNVGKTTLMCDLIKAFPEWEAIKTTRGHYRSCGKDPHACCVSDLLQDEPVVKSGRELTYSPGKDTGRYWDAGATNVHWVIATNEQVASGINEAIARVRQRGVFVEGNSFSEFVQPDFLIMVARSDQLKIKTAARPALHRASALYLSDVTDQAGVERLQAFLAKLDAVCCSLPIFSNPKLPELIEELRILNRSSICSSFPATTVETLAS